MKFEKWVETKTPRQVARALDVDQSTVWHWVKRNTCPKPKTMRAIVKLSEGQIKYDDIVGHYLNDTK